MSTNLTRSLIDMVGVQCDQLLVTGRADPVITRGKKITAWHCLCKCGNKVVRTGGYLRKRDKHSCSVDCEYRKKGTHGMSSSRQYTAWVNMKQSCMNPDSRNYAAHGARGIKVCDSWKDSFKNFWEDMKTGYSSTLYLTRINKSKDFEFGNCEWVEKRGLTGIVSQKERAYRLWRLMNRRCYDPYTKNYDRYGKVGARVCMEWRSLGKTEDLEGFENFWEDMEEEYQDGLFIGRVKVPGDFSFPNCIWTRQPRWK